MDIVGTCWYNPIRYTVTIYCSFSHHIFVLNIKATSNWSLHHDCFIRYLLWHHFPFFDGCVLVIPSPVLPQMSLRRLRFLHSKIAVRVLVRSWEICRRHLLFTMYFVSHMHMYRKNNMYICQYVYNYICQYVYMSICIYIYICAYMHYVYFHYHHYPCHHYHYHHHHHHHHPHHQHHHHITIIIIIIIIITIIILHIVHSIHIYSMGLDHGFLVFGST